VFINGIINFDKFLPFFVIDADNSSFLQVLSENITVLTNMNKDIFSNMVYSTRLQNKYPFIISDKAKNSINLSIAFQLEPTDTIDVRTFVLLKD
jgi:hypothetical protein